MNTRSYAVPSFIFLIVLRAAACPRHVLQKYLLRNARAGRRSGCGASIPSTSTTRRQLGLFSSKRPPQELLCFQGLFRNQVVPSDFPRLIYSLDICLSYLSAVHFK